MIKPSVKVLPLMLILLLVFLQYCLWFESGGIIDMMRFKKTLERHEKENAALKERNEHLLAQVQRLQKDQDEVEARARHELGMVKKGEVFYQIVQ